MRENHASASPVCTLVKQQTTKPNTMKKNTAPARRAAVALTVAFAKKGNTQGSFDIPEMAQIIDRSTGLPELLHAANVFPELVAAARNLEQSWGKNLTEPMGRLNQALALAENINREPRKRRNQHANGPHHP